MTSDEAQLPKDPVAYVENNLLGKSFDTLESHTARKSALGDTTRYAIVYLLAEYGELPKSQLMAAADCTSNNFTEVITPLVETNLIEQIPTPADNDAKDYRITTLGQQAIQHDKHQINGTHSSQK
ncbi:hypothetical protein [Salinibaculum rarum]|uniref:hypothetical protein n=1 Tax=Salinibaculum rarum TaxID=3058903 RepID=UPI00265EF0EC|nr:hypothetical protein [Salinibaculum sp. KK48]